jgi:peptidoglycan hydrolase-like protein with peptidoglycan-binding domain
MRSWLWGVGLCVLLLTAGPGLADAGESVRYVQQCLKGLGFDVGAFDGVFGTRTKGALEQFAVSRGIPKDPPEYQRIRIAVLQECIDVLKGSPPPSLQQVKQDGWKVASSGQDLAEYLYPRMEKLYIGGHITPAVWGEFQQRYTTWQQSQRDFVALLQSETVSDQEIRQSGQKVGEALLPLVELIRAHGLIQ